MLPLARAAVELRVSERRVRALVAAGELHAERVGRMWIVHSDELNRFVRTRRRQRGRRLQQSTTWALIDSGAVASSRSADRARVHVELRPRASHTLLHHHQRALRDLRERPELVLSGRTALAALGLPVDDDGPLHCYSVDRAIADGAVAVAARPSEANLILHVVDDNAYLDVARRHPVELAWLDLTDDGDRAARFALQAMRQNHG